MSATTKAWLGPRWVLLAWTVLAVLGCGDSPTSAPGEPTVRSVEVGPAGRIVPVGDTARFTAVVTAGDGSPAEGVLIRWSTSNPGTATVVGQGSSALVRGVSEGSVRIIAEAGGREGWVQTTVTRVQPLPALLEVLPASPTATVGDVVGLTAVLRTGGGDVVEGAAVTWVSQSPAVATVEPGETAGSARVTALRPGKAVIVASSGSLQSGVEVTVLSREPTAAALALEAGSTSLAAGQQTGVRAVFRTASGTVIEGRDVEWRVLDATTGTLARTALPGYALVTTHRAGEVRITAAGEGLEATLTLAVTGGIVLSSLEMRPAQLLVERGATVTLGVQAWGPDGSWFPDVPASWVSSDPTVVTVSGVGATTLLTGVREGSAEVTAAAGGVSVRATITVKIAGDVGYVIVSPRTPRMWLGSLYRLTASTLRGNGAELPDQPVAWTVEDPSVATIEADGLLLALRAGSTRVVARSGGREGWVTIRVYEQPVTELLLDLQPQEGPWGEWRPAPEFGDTTWTDPTGTTHVARRYVVAGEMQIALGSALTWWQNLEVEAIVVLPEGPKVVSRTTWRDEGSYQVGLLTPWQFFLGSTAFPGWISESSMAEAGRLISRQRLPTGAQTELVWLLR